MQMVCFSVVRVCSRKAENGEVEAKSAWLTGKLTAVDTLIALNGHRIKIEQQLFSLLTSQFNMQYNTGNTVCVWGGGGGREGVHISGDRSLMSEFQVYRFPYSFLSFFSYLDSVSALDSLR